MNAITNILGAAIEATIESSTAQIIECNPELTLEEARALAEGGLLFGNAIIQGSAGIKQALRHMSKSHVKTPHGSSGHDTPKHDIPAES